VSGQGTNTVSVSVATTFAGGTFSVTASNSCGVSTARTLTVAGCAARMGHDASNDSISGTPVKFDFVVYPNPSNGNFNIEFDSQIEKQIVVEIYDAMGKLVMSEKQTASSGVNTIRINIGEYEEGIYIVRVTDLVSFTQNFKSLVLQK
jgi:hypothetical protein